MNYLKRFDRAEYVEELVRSLENDIGELEIQLDDFHPEDEDREVIELMIEEKREELEDLQERGEFYTLYNSWD